MPVCARCHREYAANEQVCEFDGDPLRAVRRIDLIATGQTSQSGVTLGDRYTIRGFLGKGAMARVYLAEDKVTGDPVALKVLNETVARDATSRERFLREARAAALIRHPNVVDTRDVGQAPDNRPFLVMEYLFGETLNDCIRRNPIEPDLALPILQQIASALAAAHEAGILHRDVKPDNIFLVGEPGDPYALKVVDFGLAKLREGALTAAGTVVGTVEYMSPEQCLTDPTDARTDVYALGVVAYKMFTGRIPFAARENEVLLAQQLLELPTPPTQLLPSLDPHIELVVLKALRKSPQNRHASMSQFLQDIEILMGEREEPLSVGPDPVTPDVYVPRSPFAQTVAKVLYRTLGREMPRWS